MAGMDGVMEVRGPAGLEKFLGYKHAQWHAFYDSTCSRGGKGFVLYVLGLGFVPKDRVQAISDATV
jgi:hypothetical protein